MMLPATCRPVNSPDTDDSHVRHLLDQRFARADPFGRYSSSAMSETTDTPSVYSRAFSPRPAVHADSLTDSYIHKSPTFHCLYDDPSSSVLDLSEDNYSSMAPHQPYDRHDVIDDHAKVLDVNEDEDGLPRGPKMRFHSRAPWELEEGSFEEVNESESSGSIAFMAKLTGGRLKGSKADSSSPRPSTSAGRPSLESSRSILNSKRSFDTSSLSHPRGALYALAQESISTSSLGQANHLGRQDRQRGKYTLGRFRSQSPVDTNFSGQCVIQEDSSLAHPLSPPPRPSIETTSSTLDIQTGLNPRYLQHRSNDDSFHPYANPDLVKSYTTDTRSEYSHQSFIQQPGVFRHDSVMTVTDNSSPTLSKSAPPPTQDVPSMLPPKRRLSHINGRDISSPVPIRSTSLGANPPSQLYSDSRPEVVSPMLNTIPGWSERPVNPGFSLISLEEARAQHPRPVPVQPPPSSSDPPPSSRGTSTLTSLHADCNTHTARVFVDSDAQYVSGSNGSNSARHSRTRSVSAGAKAMNTLQSIVKQPERRDSEISPVTGQSHAKDASSVSGGKSLKHRKSGFLRLFGSSGKDERPPPVPTVPSQLSSTNSALSETVKPSSYRIPAPNVSPSLLDTTPQHDNDGSSYSSGRSNSRRLAPSLSINTTPSLSPVSPPPRGSSITASSSQATIPKSAPARTSDFPALKLRPVSSLFSAHFADHIDVSELAFDDFDGVKSRTNSKTGLERSQDRPRQNSLASGSVSSALTSESGASFADSQYIITSMASPNTSTPVTALTTPTTPGVISPISTWHRDRDRVGGRESIDQYSARPPSSRASSSVAVSAPHIVVDGEMSTVKILQEHLESTNKMWQERVWELEKQITQLKNEVAELKKGETREEGKQLLLPSQQYKSSMESVGGVLNRPRARTGGSSRFVNGQL